MFRRNKEVYFIFSLIERTRTRKCKFPFLALDITFLTRKSTPKLTKETSFLSLILIFLLLVVMFLWHIFRYLYISTCLLCLGL